MEIYNEKEFYNAVIDYWKIFLGIRITSITWVGSKHPPINEYRVEIKYLDGVGNQREFKTNLYNASYPDYIIRNANMINDALQEIHHNYY